MTRSKRKRCVWRFAVGDAVRHVQERWVGVVRAIGTRPGIGGHPVCRYLVAHPVTVYGQRWIDDGELEGVGE